jgi:hypothetical protein
MTAQAPVNISDLKNPPARELPTVSPGFGDLASFELLQRGAKLLSASPLVPEIYRGPDGIPSCVIALNMALRMNADPLMVMQNLDIIHGRPSWRAQFLIACFNQCGRFSTMRFRWSGTRDKDDWTCCAWARELASGEEIVGPEVSIGLAKAEGWYNRNGSKWKTIPVLMLMYRAAAWCVRTYAPEIAMGLPTREETEEIIDLTPEQYSVADVASGEHAKSTREAPNPETPRRGRPRKAAEIIAKPAETPKPFDLAGGFSYAQVRDALERASKAKDAQGIDDAEVLIDFVEPQFRGELQAIAAEARQGLQDV